MPFKKYTDKILAGSLNLLPPGDLLLAGDSTQLQNWRSDQAGQLRSRSGLTPESAVITAATSGVRFFRSGQDRYASTGALILYGADLALTINGSFGFFGYDVSAFAGMGDAVWIMNPTKRIFAYGANAKQWGVDAPVLGSAYAQEAVLPNSGNLSGAFSYFLTFANDFGHESNPSAALSTWDKIGGGNVPISVTDVAPRLNALPVSTDPQVTVKHIYRIGGNVQTASRVATVLNGVTTWDDTISVAAQQILNVTIPTDHDVPPPCYGLAGPYFGRLLAFRSVAFPGRYWWSKTSQPWAWPGSGDEFEGNWQDCGDVREAILAAAYHKRQVRLYKEKSIWRLEGDPAVSDPERTNSEVGILGPNAIASYGDVDYFLGPEGIYAFNGDREQKISWRIEPIFRGESTRIGDVTVLPLNQAFASTTVMAVRYGRLYVSYPSGSNSAPSTTLVYDIATERWYTHKLATGIASPGYEGFYALYNEGTGGAFLGGVFTSAGVKVYSVEDGPHDDGTAIPLIWQSRFLDQGAPDNEKVYQDLTIDYSTADVGDAVAPATLTVKALYDNGGAVETLGTLNSAARTRKTFTMGAYPGRLARNVAVRIEGDTYSTVRIYESTLNAYLEPRKARHWDSGYLDFGTRKLKQLLAIELDVEASSTLTIEFHNDNSGMGLAATKAAFYPGGPSEGWGGRRLVYLQDESVPVTLWDSANKALDAREYRFVVTAPEGQWFKLYGFRAKVRPIGTYLVGATGEIWLPDPIGN